jgi:hypothetical protein
MAWIRGVHGRFAKTVFKTGSTNLVQFTVYLSVVTVYLTYMNSAGFLNGFSEPE